MSACFLRFPKSVKGRMAEIYPKKKQISSLRYCLGMILPQVSEKCYLFLKIFKALLWKVMECFIY